MTAMIRTIRTLLVAALATGAIASIVQTQLNLGELLRLGAPVTSSVRLWTTLEDLARFGPVMFGIAAAALLLAVLAPVRVHRGQRVWSGFRLLADALGDPHARAAGHPHGCWPWPDVADGDRRRLAVCASDQFLQTE